MFAPREYIWALRNLIRSPGLTGKTDVADYYSRLGDDVIDGLDGRFADPNKPLWFNLGYWKRERTYDRACAALAQLLGEAAGLGPADRVLDVGFGFAEQDLCWVDQFDVQRIVGVNVTPLQVEVARKRVEQHGRQDRIDLRLGSATDLRFEPGAFDKVLALECAFHFDTREDFFAEAHRVLRPGGRLATADMLPMQDDLASAFGMVKRWARRRVAIPDANIYDRAVYREKLEQRGFVDVNVRSIREHVYPGMAKYLKQRVTAGAGLQSVTVELDDDDIRSCRGVEMWKGGGISDYVIVTADKKG